MTPNPSGKLSKNTSDALAVRAEQPFSPDYRRENAQPTSQTPRFPTQVPSRRPQIRHRLPE